MAVYLDSSALVKLVVAESESEALRRFLARRPVRVCSALALVEVPRAVRHHGGRAEDRARRVLARVRLLRMDEAILNAAASLDPRVMRSLDAIHLASARELAGDLDDLVTYDQRMSEAARMLGISVRAPGTRQDRPKRARRRAVRRPLRS